MLKQWKHYTLSEDVLKAEITSPIRSDEIKNIFLDRLIILKFQHVSLLL